MEDQRELTPEMNEAQEKEIAEINGAKITDYKVDKFKALYQSRTVLSEIGTMEERRICSTQLKRMKKLGIASV